MTDTLFVITISHQLGSGGSMLGQNMAERLGIPFFDHEILKRVAEDLHLAESEIETREERLSTFWESLSRSMVMGDPTAVLAMDHFSPSDEDLFDHECEVIAKIAEKSSGVFLGRCGFYTLRDHPRHLNILVHAGINQRIQRVRQLFHLDDESALKMIQNNDRERAAYVHAFTRQNWLDTRLYDLTINTSSLGMEKTLEFALAAAAQKIGAAQIQPA